MESEICLRKSHKSNRMIGIQCYYSNNGFTFVIAWWWGFFSIEILNNKGNF
jgi:hypothetical protein